MPDKRTTLANSSLLVLLLLAVITSLSVGTVQVPPPDVLQALMGNADPMTAFVVNELRLSRVVAGLLSGAALAMAGCLMQTLARNRLATPGIIGIDNAATAFAVASVVGVGLSLARTICRPGKVPLAASALAGATFMVAADLLGRTLFSPLEIPVGIITAIVGSPYLLWILLKPSRRSLT